MRVILAYSSKCIQKKLNRVLNNSGRSSIKSAETTFTSIQDYNFNYFYFVQRNWFFEAILSISNYE